MGKIRFMGLLTVLVAACGIPKNSSNLQIIGGTAFCADDPLAKSMVAIMDRNGGVLCTGVVLGPQHFLTAAHCGMLGQLKGAEVRVGIDVQSSSSSTKIASWTTHEDFNPAGLTESEPTYKPADLTIVRTVTDMAGTIALPIVPAETEISVGSVLRIAGYGRSVGDDRTSSGKALYWDFDVKVMNSSASEMILTDKAIRMACHGDSGGPVFATIGGQPVIAGIVSRGKRECDTNKSIITDLRSYSAWISEHREN